MLAAVAFGYKQFSDSLRAFDEGVAFSQKNAIDIEAVEISFKKQVQEWKDVLLRGKKPEALEKYWAAFQQRETDVRDLANRVEPRVVDPEALQFVTQFIAAHKTMGDAYRRGLQQFKEHDFDSSAGDQAVAGMDRGPTEGKRTLVCRLGKQSTP
jgi:methyl-accepting chemotaxis protein